MHGSPWHNREDLSRRFNARLDALHVIRSSRAVFADRLDPDDSVGELLRHAFAPIHDVRWAERLFDAAAWTVSHVPVLRPGLPEGRRLVSSAGVAARPLWLSPLPSSPNPVLWWMDVGSACVQ